MLCCSARGVGVGPGDVVKLAEVSSEVWSSWRCHEPRNDDAVVGTGHLGCYYRRSSCAEQGNSDLSSWTRRRSL